MDAPLRSLMKNPRRYRFKMEEQNVPQLRFPEFKENWNRSFIGDHYSNLRTGMTPYRGKPEYYDGDIPWISSGELNYGYIFDTAEKITEEAVKETNLIVYPIGTFFIAITGLEAPGTRGKCAINGVPAATNQSCMAFREVEGLSTKFLFYWYHKYGVKLYFEYAQGTKQQSFNNKLVEIFPISHPKKSEQQKIASFLSAVDKKIEQLTRKKELLEEYKKGVMQKLFPKPGEQHPELRFKDENGEDFPDWEVKRLGEVGKFSKGKGISKKDIDEGGKYPCIRYGELYTEYKELIDEVVSNTNLDTKKLTLSQRNDVLIPSSGETHIDIATASCILKDDVILGGDINILRSKVNGIFLSYLLNNAYKFRIANLAQGNSVVHLYSSQLKSLEVSLPTNNEQKRIVNFLTNIDEKINSVEESIQKTQTFKKGLLQQMFV